MVFIFLHSREEVSVAGALGPQHRTPAILYSIFAGTFSTASQIETGRREAPRPGVNDISRAAMGFDSCSILNSKCSLSILHRWWLGSGRWSLRPPWPGDKASGSSTLSSRKEPIRQISLPLRVQGSRTNMFGCGCLNCANLMVLI